MPKVCFMEHT